MYIPLGNAHHGRLGSPVINPFDTRPILDQRQWKYGFHGFSQAETDDEEDEENGKKKARLVTKSNPRSIYNGYGSFAGTGSTIAGGVVGAIMATGILAAAWKLKGSTGDFKDKLKENWYCIAGGAAMIVAWEMFSGVFR